MFLGCWTFLCVGVCVGGGVATSSLFVSLLPNSFRSLSKLNVLASSPMSEKLFLIYNFDIGSRSSMQS
jgi:hypothetical protein